MPALALAGPISSGKSTVAAELSRRLGWQVCSFGAALRIEADRRGLPSTRPELQAFGGRLLEELGARAFCELALTANGLTGVQALIWDGVRHVGVHRALADLHDEQVPLVYLDPPERERLARALQEAGSPAELERWEADETESHRSELTARAWLHCRAASPAQASAEIAAALEALGSDD